MGKNPPTNKPKKQTPSFVKPWYSEGLHATAYDELKLAAISFMAMHTEYEMPKKPTTELWDGMLPFLIETNEKWDEFVAADAFKDYPEVFKSLDKTIAKIISAPTFEEQVNAKRGFVPQILKPTK